MVPLAMMLVINVRQLLRRAQALDFGHLGQANDDAWVLQARRAVDSPGHQPNNAQAGSRRSPGKALQLEDENQTRS